MTGEITKVDEVSISTAVVPVPETGLTSSLPGVNSNAYQLYIDRYMQFFPSECLAGMRLGFYEHSSVARDLLREILERLGAEVISLGGGNEFVPIDTEAVSETDVQQARCWAKQYILTPFFPPMVTQIGLCSVMSVVTGSEATSLASCARNSCRRKRWSPRSVATAPLNCAARSRR